MTALGTKVIPSVVLGGVMAPVPSTPPAASLSRSITHPANVLVMGPGGCRCLDHLKVKLPLTVLVPVIVMTGLPSRLSFTR